MMLVYGIHNCDTMKKAVAWLQTHGIACSFHDYRKAGVPIAALTRWVETIGWEQLLNTRGTTFRQLPIPQCQPMDATRALAVIVELPACIRRPIVESDGVLAVGFTESRFRSLVAGP
jgi:arsenate reductase (glutaredoxin)